MAEQTGNAASKEGAWVPVRAQAEASGRDPLLPKRGQHSRGSGLCPPGPDRENGAWGGGCMRERQGGWGLGSEQLNLKRPDCHLENNSPQGQGATVDPGERWVLRLIGTWRAGVGSQRACGHFPREGRF